MLEVVLVGVSQAQQLVDAVYLVVSPGLDLAGHVVLRGRQQHN